MWNNLPLLHGSLGWADELIFASVVVIFMGIMVVQWVAMRAADDEDQPEKKNQPQTTSEAGSQNDDDTFRLD